jgi:hypothetical protein
MCTPSVRQFSHRHKLEDPSNNIFFVLQIFVETLEQRWLEVSLDPVLFIFATHVSLA